MFSGDREVCSGYRCVVVICVCSGDREVCSGDKRCALVTGV